MSQADRWATEFEQGIGASGIRPGFIKVGVNWPLEEIDRKLVTAAARCHRSTGLTIAVHSGLAAAALPQIDILARERVAPSAWVWVHAQVEPDGAKHVQAAERGGWISFDGIAPRSIERHVDLVVNMKRSRLLHRVLISQDAGWYHVGQPGGGHYRGYDTLFTEFLPALRRAGFTDEEVRQLTVANAAEALAIRARLL
jgi:predicted metal-dependent phosphotriesterase family hydrolase